MLLFLDTEFTDLVVLPRLLSVGLVGDIPGRNAAGCADAADFYAEVTDLDRLRSASWFALSAVLPQFGQVAGAGCSYHALGLRLGDHLRCLSTSLAAGECVEIVFGYALDWDLVDLAIRDADAPRWAFTRQRLKPCNVYDTTGFGAGALASQAYFRTQAQAAFGRHHALCDARALRAAWGAAASDDTSAHAVRDPHVAQAA